jgi:hypothetical protein
MSVDVKTPCEGEGEISVSMIRDRLTVGVFTANSGRVNFSQLNNNDLYHFMPNEDGTVNMSDFRCKTRPYVTITAANGTTLNLIDAPFQYPNDYPNDQNLADIGFDNMITQIAIPQELIVTLHENTDLFGKSVILKSPGTIDSYMANSASRIDIDRIARDRPLYDPYPLVQKKMKRKNVRVTSYYDQPVVFADFPDQWSVSLITTLTPNQSASYNISSLFGYHPDDHIFVPAYFSVVMFHANGRQPTLDGGTDGFVYFARDNNLGMTAYNTLSPKSSISESDPEWAFRATSITITAIVPPGAP